MNNCTAGALVASVITGLLMSLVVPEHPEKAFAEANAALRADNAILVEKLLAQAEKAMAEEKKRTEAAMKSCQR